MGGVTARGEVLWTPPDDVWTATDAGRFATANGFGDYASLHAWSVAEPEAFWRACTEFTGVRWRQPTVGDARRRRRCPACAGSPAPR